MDMKPGKSIHVDQPGRLAKAYRDSRHRHISTDTEPQMPELQPSVRP